ncbi:hypothetical protein OROHE_026379 [Orobanche hederae]
MRQQDDEEADDIKRKEQWRWSELQGLELLVDDDNNNNNNDNPSSSCSTYVNSQNHNQTEAELEAAESSKPSMEIG